MDKYLHQAIRLIAGYFPTIITITFGWADCTFSVTMTNNPNSLVLRNSERAV